MVKTECTHRCIGMSNDGLKRDVTLEARLIRDLWSKDLWSAVQYEAPPVPTLRHMVWNVKGNHTSESSHAGKRYQESFRPAGGSAKVKMRSCCSDDAER